MKGFTRLVCLVALVTSTVAGGRVIAGPAAAGRHAAGPPEGGRHDDGKPAERFDVLQRSQVWTPTDVASANMVAGPDLPGSFTPGQTITCDYVDKKLAGGSPKFACRLGDDDELKVKFGGTNGEVYGEVLATRLLWALGFPADRIYPVNVICRGCPRSLGGIARPGNESRFAPAIVERKFDGHEFKGEGGSAWKWIELGFTNPERGGATQAQRDALKLLAVFLQHTDNKAQQQRLVCLDDGKACEQPLMMINDVGLTFGRATLSNGNTPSSVNLQAWRSTPVWRAGEACVGNLPKSFTGTLENPAISEEGRAFLADLLMQLTDQQLRDLFTVARVELRLREPGKALSGFSTVDEWVDAFKAKRNQIVERRCA